jgi:3D (Asp-Asp-Asp) domain-containing protein
MIIILKILMALAALNFIITGIELYIIYRTRDSVFKIICNAIYAICAIVMFFLYLNSILDEVDNKKNIKEVKKIKIIKDSVVIDTIPFRKIKATYYNPVSSQCDGNPLITGSGYKINVKKLKNKNINIVALSRDLLNIYPYGSEIYVHQPVHLRGCWKVEDTMNKRFSNKIDFLVYDKVKVDSVHISI